MPAIKVSDETYKRLNVIAGEMRKKTGKPVSMEHVVSRMTRQDLDSRIAALKPRKEISACYLFGSVAKGLEGRDTDVGLLLAEDFIKPALYEGEIIRELESSGVRNPDVRILNGLPARFLNQVLRHGRLVFSNDEGARVKFEAEATKRFIDMKPLHEEYDRQRMRRLASCLTVT